MHETSGGDQCHRQEETSPEYNAWKVRSAENRCGRVFRWLTPSRDMLSVTAGLGYLESTMSAVVWLCYVIGHQMNASSKVGRVQRPRLLIIHMYTCLAEQRSLQPTPSAMPALQQVQGSFQSSKACKGQMHVRHVFLCLANAGCLAVCGSSMLIKTSYLYLLMTITIKTAHPCCTRFP